MAVEIIVIDESDIKYADSGLLYTLTAIKFEMATKRKVNVKPVKDAKNKPETIRPRNSPSLPETR